MSSSSFPSTDSSGFPSTDTNDPSASFDSGVSSITTAAIISTVVGSLVWIAIVVLIYKCLKKVKVSNLSIPVRVQNSSADPPTKPPTSDIVSTPPQSYPVIRDSQINGATLERFLVEIAREKPIRFSPQQLAGITQNYSTKLGSGGYGDVYKGEFDDGVKVAVKVLKQNSDKKVQEQFMAEVGTLGRTYHINLVRLYGFCLDPLMRALVYEYMENGSLDKFLFGGNRVVEWSKLHEIAVGTAKGIAYLHEECQQRITHYDIKPENVLLDENLRPKVADFGLAKLCNIGSTEVMLTGCRGTPGYAAPELWMPYPVTQKCDVYSFGIVLFETIGRRRSTDPNVSETREWLPRWTWNMFVKGALEEMVMQCGIEEKDREKAKRMSMVALWCIQYVPETRPNMSSVVKMLEGVIEIAPPPNPFAHLESTGMNITSGSGSDYTDSMASEQFYSKNVRGTTKAEAEITSVHS